MAKKKRPTRTQRSEEARCTECDWRYGGAGAQGRAALHYDETKHVTETDVRMKVAYGIPPEKK